MVTTNPPDAADAPRLAPPMDEPPKRRNPGAFTSETARAAGAKAKGRPKGSKNKPKPNAGRDRAPRQPRRPSLRDEISFFLTTANTVAAMVAPDDALDETEMGLLAEALEAEFKAHPEWRGMLEKAAGLSPHLMLINAAVIIAIPRLARRGILPGMDPAQADELAAAMRDGSGAMYPQGDDADAPQRFAVQPRPGIVIDQAGYDFGTPAPSPVESVS